jgi:hypothetical protein
VPWTLAAIAALGLALRLAGIHHGLPDIVEEAAPFRWALDMWSNPDGRIDPNPHHFIYPSLVIYLHLALQRIHLAIGSILGAFQNPSDYMLSYRLDPTAMVLLARGLGVVADVVTIVTAGRIGERFARGAGLVAALMIACSPIMIRTSRTIYTDPVMTMLAVVSLERMQLYRPGQGALRRVLIAVLIGLAAGAKYPGIVLLAPFAWTLVSAHGRARGASLLLLTLPVVAGTFLATTPYAVLDAPVFLRDLRFDRHLATEGLLGATGPPSGWLALRELGSDLGPVAAAFAVAGTGIAAWRCRSAPFAVTLLLFGTTFLAPVVLSPLRFERYLLSVLPAVGLLAGVAITALVSRPAPSRRRWVAAGLASALALPTIAAAVPAALRGVTTTQLEARRWCLKHVGPRDVLIQERYGARLPTRTQQRFDLQSTLVANASPSVRERYLRRPFFAATLLPLSVGGSCTAMLRAPNGEAVEVEVFPHASDFNRVVYDPRLLAGVDYVVTAQSMRGRFEADPARYAGPLSFYAHLDSFATVVARFTPHDRVTGSEITIHRLGRSDTSGTAPAVVLGRWWWTDHIPERFRRQANQVLDPARTGTTAPAGPDGAPAPWVRGLRDLYNARLTYFCEELAANLIDAGRFTPARRLMDAELAVTPDDPRACDLYVQACLGSRDLPAARVAIERMVASNSDPRAVPPSLLLVYADVLEELGMASRAAAVRDSIGSHGGE